MPDLLRINEPIVYFAYGQVFFTLGVIIALHSRKHSQIALARHLGWLAAFGITHGIYEWGHAFIPIQAEYLSPQAVAVLQTTRTAILATSFYLLLQFGVLIACPHPRRSWPLYLIPLGALLTWFALSLATGAIVFSGPSLSLLWPGSSDLARVVLGFAGAATASFGMVRQGQIVAELGPHRIAWYFRWAALCLGFYAIAAGLVASRGEWTVPALSGLQFLNDFVTIPPQVLRPIAGLGIAFGVVRGLEVFQFETDRFMDERAQLQRKEEVRTYLLGRVIAAQEDERKRVARELHDETGQNLSAVIMGLGAAAENLPRDTAKTGDILEDVREIAVQALEGIRQIILGLRPALLDDLGLAPALRRMAEDISKRSSIQIKISSDGVDRRLPPAVETVLFRILQEGMNNVAHHSQARHAELRLSLNESYVTAVLNDDGIGFKPMEATAHLESGCGLGLVGMRERASLLGGAVIIDSAPGRGTRLQVRLPLTERS